MQIQCKTFKGPDFLSCCLSLPTASVLQFFEILPGLHSKSLRLLVCKCKNFSGLTQLYSGFQVYFGTSWCDDSKHGLWKQKIHSPWQYTTAYLCAVGCCVGQAGQGSSQTQDHCWSPAMALQWLSGCESTRSLTLAARRKQGGQNGRGDGGSGVWRGGRSCVSTKRWPCRAGAGRLAWTGSRPLLGANGSVAALTVSAIKWQGKGWSRCRASAQSELTQGGCTSLQQDWRVVQQTWIYAVQVTSGSKVQCTAAESLSTVQHCWLQSC